MGVCQSWAVLTVIRAPGGHVVKLTKMARAVGVALAMWSPAPVVPRAFGTPPAVTVRVRRG